MWITDIECKSKAWEGTSNQRNSVTWHRTCRDILSVKCSLLEVFKDNIQVFISYSASGSQHSKWHNLLAHLLDMLALLSDKIENIAKKLLHFFCMFCYTHWHDLLEYKWKNSFSHIHFTSDSHMIVSQAHLFPNLHSLVHFTCTFSFHIYKLSSKIIPSLALHIHTCTLTLHTYICKIS